LTALRYSKWFPARHTVELLNIRAASCNMPQASSLLAFALIWFGLVLTPGPNRIYLILRSIAQGRTAGLVSLGGGALGFVFYMLCAALGVTALLFAVPYA
jgi:threonine/homoserine/homoserine lactone efflux protein